MEILHSGFLILTCMIQLCYTITREQYTELQRQCNSQLIEGQNRGRRLPQLVRLIFHDCVGDGGCNGCIDHNNEDNLGLEIINNLVVDAYKSAEVNSTLVSLADFIAICGVTAVEQAYRDNYNGVSSFQFKTGRVTKDTCNGDNDGKFPLPMDGYEKTMMYLKTMFGFTTDREAIVLLGAHSLGQMSGNQSGFVGPWTQNQASLDNGYYRELIMSEEESWPQNNVNDSGKFMWMTPKDLVQNGTQPPPPPNRRKRELVEAIASVINKSYRVKRQAPPPGPKGKKDRRPVGMLNADMGLLKNMSITETGESATCPMNISMCPDSPGRPIIEDLFSDNTMFINEFIVVFTKMIEKVPSDVTLAAVTYAPEEPNGAAVATASFLYVMLVSLFLLSFTN